MRRVCPLQAMVQRHKGIFGGCWCTWFHDGHPSCVGRGETFEGNRAIKKRLVDEGVARAALVMDGDEAIAWASRIPGAAVGSVELRPIREIVRAD